MRRYALIVIVLLLALLAGPIQIARSMPNNGPDSAARAQMDPVALARLGRYLRPDALLYAAVRTDPASFAQLDRVMARFQAALPPGALDPGLPLRVESLLSELIGLDFTRLVRPWMGDVAALAIYPQDALVGAEWRYGSSDYPVMAAIAITDRNVAAAFVEQNAAGWTRTDRAGYTVFMPQDEYNHSGILIRDDVLIIASYADLLPLDGPPAFSLTHSRTFNKTIALLPGSSYNALMYVDLPMLIAQAVGDDYDVQPEARVLINAVLRMIGPEAAGMTVGDERGIVIDVVQPVGNIAALEALDLAFGPGTPVDPAFVTALPGTAALVLHGANPGAIYDMARQAAGALTGGGLLQAPVTDSIFRP
ncbi:MAG: hypothetical protein JW910_08935, partial [Anaerolineae bacterium]|nr:hypothetical protein [Anaerolineae bacterium]